MLGLLGLSGSSKDILVLDFDAKPFRQIQKTIPEAIRVKYPRDAAVVALIWSRMDVDRMPSLRYIVNASRGTDHLDVRKLSQAGVTILDIPPYCTDPVSDYVTNVVQQHHHGSEHPVVTIVGSGEIGLAVQRKLLETGATVHILHHDSHENDVADAMGRSSFVTLHMPLTNESRKWLNARRIGYLKNASIINTSRAAEVDEKALLDGLRSGNVAHAYLDVLGNRSLAKTQGVTFTRHTAWKSAQSEQLRLQYTIDKLKVARNAILADPK